MWERILGLSLAACLGLHAQDLSQAPFQTVPNQNTPTQSPPEPEILTPETVLPDGFTFRADRLDLRSLLAGNNYLVNAFGNIRVRTNRGDTLTSTRAQLDFTENESSSRIIFERSVRLRSNNGIEVFADRAVLDETKQTITFTGNVAAYQGSLVHRGDQAIYNYESRKLQTSGLRTSLDPILLEAGQFQADNSGPETVYRGTDAGITTHDSSEPNFWLRGEKVTVVANESIRFKNLKIYAGDTPILWLPGLTQDFNGQFNYRPTPGMRSNWGPYLLNEYRQEWGGDLDPVSGLRRNAPYEALWNLDFYGRRGVGSGLQIHDLRQENNPNLGWASLYYIHDFDPGLRRSAEPRTNFDDPERLMLQLRQRWQADWLPNSNGHLNANLTFLTDRFFLEDFRPDIFQTDFNPDNTLSLAQAWQDSQLLTIWTRLPINEHYQSDRRYPEIAFDQIRRPLLNTPILHESQNTFGIYREEIADFTAADLRAEAANPATTPARLTEINTLLSDIGFTRLHTSHELSLPLKLDSGLHLIPRLGAGYSRYDSVDGGVDSFSRTHLHASVDASLKFSRAYPEWISKKWGLDSALHIIQPYATATILGSSDAEPGFRGIDRLTASTRPRALTPGRFHATDSLADWGILRLGTRNRILTKRDNSSHNWLTLDSYIDIFSDDPEFDRNLSNLYNDLHWSPLPWLDLTVETQVPLFSDSNFTELATGLQYMPSSDTEIGLTYRFLNSHPILDDSNRLALRAYHRINEEWGIGSRHIWEFEDSTLEFQQYSLHRNLDSWAFTLGLFARDNLDEDEYGIMFGFTLIDFPSLSLPLRVDN
ncbi:MAG: LptA/OstA family protein [Verrucomicrobiota bacterium]